MAATLLTNTGRSAGSLSRIESIASTRAKKPPVMLAVRVPPSASSTSQSTVIVRGPSAARSTAARKLRPTSRWISWLRPSICAPLPFFPRRGAAGQHAVFGRNPAGGILLFSLPGRNAFVDAGRAQDGGAAGLNQHAARSAGREAAPHDDRAQRRRPRGRHVAWSSPPNSQTNKPFCQVHAVFRLLKHDALRAVHDVVGHFQAALGGQVVHEAGRLRAAWPSAAAFT